MRSTIFPLNAVVQDFPYYSDYFVICFQKIINVSSKWQGHFTLADGNPLVSQTKLTLSFKIWYFGKPRTH
jgi:hypothetical protein